MVSFTLVLNTLLNQLSSKCTVSVQLSVSVNLLLTCELLTNLTKEMDKNMYGIVLCIQLAIKVGKEPAGEILLVRSVKC
jgi:hypothetical protein